LRSFARPFLEGTASVPFRKRPWSARSSGALWQNATEGVPDKILATEGVPSSAPLGAR